MVAEQNLVFLLGEAMQLVSTPMQCVRCQLIELTSAADPAGVSPTICNHSLRCGALRLPWPQRPHCALTL